MTDHPPHRANDTWSLVVGSIASDDDADTVDTVAAAAFARAQLPRRYGSILLGSEVAEVPAAALRLFAHNCAVHAVPGGTVSVPAGQHRLDDHLRACGFAPVGSSGDRSVWRRTERWTIHDVAARARARLERITPDTLAAELRSGATMVVDLRIPADRSRHGVIDGSVAVPRTVLEWRADPTSGFGNDAFRSFDQRVVVVCNEGYSSSIGAAALQDLGYDRATDLIGGMVAWIADGHPITSPSPDDEGPFAGPVEES